MKSKSILVPLIILCGSILAGAAFAQESSAVPFSSSFSEQTASATGREEELYKDGTDYLNENQWQQAADKFAQVAALKGRRADAALYWRAYSLNKAARRAEATATLVQLRRDYPKSEWLKEAGALEVEMKQAAGQPVDPSAQADEELKVLAINSLMNTDPERAIPLLQGVLSNPNNSAKLKDRALFVLAQNDSPKAEQMITAFAKGQSGTDLQIKAIRYMGISGRRYSTVLQEIYSSAADVSVKKAVLQAYMTSGAKEPVLAAAKEEKNPELRRAAIHQLGAMGADKELEQLFQSATSTEDKETILQAFGVAGDTDALIKAAKDSNDPSIRARAVRNLGPFGGSQAGPALLQIYNTEKDPQLRRAAIEALFIRGDAGEMVTLARKETDPQMKRELVQKLSLMDSKEARDYMLEILNK